MFKKSVIAIIIAALGIGVFYFAVLRDKPAVEVVENPEAPRHEVIGKSAEGRDIEAYAFGNGTKNIVFVGGIHGGYEWNSTLLAYQFIDYLDKNPEFIPDNLAVSVVPSANPDGLYKVVGKEGRFDAEEVAKDENILASGRFNANGVDLNRNFDCKWQPEATWRSKAVSAGTAAFSEPEAAALKNFISRSKPEAVIFWHSMSNAVYASECENGILPETLDIMNAYSQASGYPAIKSFDGYAVTGDAEGWLSSIGIPAITVELKTHEDIEWERNFLGIKSLLQYYRQK